MGNPRLPGDGYDCFICQASGDDPTVKFDHHHVIPSHLGGYKNSPLVKLCVSCHRNVHASATALMKDKPVVTYATDDANKKLLFLAERIVKATNSFKQSGAASKAKITKVNLELDAKSMDRLRAIAKYQNFNQHKTIEYAIDVAYSLLMTDRRGKK